MAGHIAVIGAGRMGIPMAQALAAAGYAVDLADLKPRDDEDRVRLERRARDEWAANAALAASPDASWQLITFRSGCGPWLQAADAVFEALPEDADLKADAYRELEAWLPQDCPMGSTTSALTPDRLAGALAHPARFMVTHWLYPAWVMPLVEVAPGAGTDPAAVERMLAILRRAGKVPVQLAGRPGLAVVRLQTLIMNEAARMAAEGLGTPAEIDRAVRLGLGFRFLGLGLLAFADAGGVDTLYRASRYLAEALGDARFEPAAPVAELVRQGHLGRGTGRGFYDWQNPQDRPDLAEALRMYLHLGSSVHFCASEPCSEDQKRTEPGESP